MSKVLRGFIKRGKLGRYYKQTKNYRFWRGLYDISHSKRTLAYVFRFMSNKRAFGVHWKEIYARTIINTIFKEIRDDRS